MYSGSHHSFFYILDISLIRRICDNSPLRLLCYRVTPSHNHDTRGHFWVISYSESRKNAKKELDPFAKTEITNYRTSSTYSSSSSNPPPPAPCLSAHSTFQPSLLVELMNAVVAINSTIMQNILQQ